MTIFLACFKQVKRKNYRFPHQHSDVIRGNMMLKCIHSKSSCDSNTEKKQGTFKAVHNINICHTEH